MTKCPNGSTPLKDAVGCGFDCAPGQNILTNNDAFCVSSLCPQLTVQSVDDNSTCFKTPMNKTGSDCPVRYSEWTAGQCYPDCPPQYRENGTSCIKIPTKRPSTGYDCGFFTVWSGSRCEANFYFNIAVALSVFIILPIIGTILYSRRVSCPVAQNG